MTANETLLQDMVREILRELIAQPGADLQASSEVVNVADQASLDQAMQRMTTDAAARSAFDRGALRFRYGGLGANPPAPVSAPLAPTAHRVESGPLTERIVINAARSGKSIEIARGVVVTPLARDRARALGVSIQMDR